MTLAEGHAIMRGATQETADILGTYLSVVDPTGTVAAMAAAQKGENSKAFLYMAAGALRLPKGLNSSRLLSGATNLLTSTLSKATGLQVVVTQHTARRFIERVLTPGGSLQAVTPTPKLLAKTLQHGETFTDAKHGSYVAVHKGVAIAYVLQKGKLVVKTIEPATNVKEGARFKRVDRPF
jgi:hypothetical protein